MKDSSSIKQVALRAGVSTATVSTIINQKARASTATINRVRQAMEDLNYIPRPLHRRPGPRAKLGSPFVTRRIALLFFGYQTGIFRVPLFTDFTHGVQAALQERDLTMILANVPLNGRLPTDVEQREVDGVLLVGPRPAGQARAILAKKPTVHVLGTAVDWADSVAPDNELVGQLAANYLLGSGHKQCAYIEDASNAAFHQRGLVFNEAVHAGQGHVEILSSMNMAIVTARQYQGDREILAPLVDRMLALNPRPTGLFVCSDLLTATVYPLLYERGIIPGRDIDIISCNNELPLLSGLHPRPAVVDLQIEKVGRRAVEQLIWRIEHPGEPLMRVLVAPCLHDPEVTPASASIPTLTGYSGY